MKFPGFVGGSYTPQSLTLDAEETINLYVERSQSEGAENVAALLPTPGFTRWSAVADVGGRGACVANGRLFFVMGGGVYEFDINGTATRRATVAIDANPAQIIFNGVVAGQLGIASGGNVYSYNLTTNVLAGPHLAGGYTHLVFAASRGLALNPTTGKGNVSNLNDLSTWDAGTFFQRSLFADPYQAMFVDTNNLVWLIGTDTFEVRYDSGVGTQPFIPLSGLVGRYGIAAPFAFGLSALGNGWLVRNTEGIGQFVVTKGSVPQPVSTYAMNSAVAGYLRSSRIDDAEVLMYEQEGHTSANISFPSAPATWSYDFEGQMLTKRGQYNATLGRYDVWAPRVHCVAFGRHLVADRSTGTIWTMDTTIGTDINGTGIRRLRRSPHLNREHKRVPLDQFELLMDVGQGVALGQGSNPLVMLRVSKDGGKTFGNERQASVGKSGDWSKRVYWTQLGAPADAVFEVSYTEPVPFRITDAFLNNQEVVA